MAKASVTSKISTTTAGCVNTVDEERAFLAESKEEDISGVQTRAVGNAAHWSNNNKIYCRNPQAEYGLHYA